LEHSFSALGSLLDAEQIWFAIKSRASDADSDALLFLDLSGVITLARLPAPDPSLGGITLEDATAGNMRIRLDESATSAIAATAGQWAIKIRTSAGDDVTRAVGPLVIERALIQAI
jgi:hypothetical protein